MTCVIIKILFIFIELNEKKKRLLIIKNIVFIILCLVYINVSEMKILVVYNLELVTLIHTNNLKVFFCERQYKIY